MRGFAKFFILSVLFWMTFESTAGINKILKSSDLLSRSWSQCGLNKIYQV
jgi:hypothetical protein